MMITVNTVCPMCGKMNSVVVDADAYERWMNRELNIQDAFPTLTDNERELLISGICPECWRKMESFYDDKEDGKEIS